MASNAARPLTARQQQIVDAADSILESEGRDALTMRRLAAELGIKAPSLYKHFPDKAAVETALIERGFRRWGERAREAISRGSDSLADLAAAYRALAIEGPHLYRLMTSGVLDRARIESGLEDWSGAPLGVPFRDPETARAFWAFMHGMVILEIDGRFPLSADLDSAWSNGLSAFRSLSSEEPRPDSRPSRRQTIS